MEMRKGVKVRDMDGDAFVGNYMQMCESLAENMGLPFQKFKAMPDHTWIRWSGEFREKFGYMGIGECMIAISAKTISEYEEKPEHYHTFSADYVLKVFTQYKKWAQKKLNEANRMSIEEQPDTTPEKAHEIFLNESVLPAYEAYLHQFEDRSELQYPEIFELLQERGLVEFKPEEKWELMERAKRELVDQMTDNWKGVADAFAAKVENIEIGTVKIKRLAMTYACRLAFSILDNKGYSISKLRTELS